MDIEEILDVGIDVYTAVNIQHIASLSYEVAQITQARVNETIPDSFIQSADELVVVDVTPEELIKRLEQGKFMCKRWQIAHYHATFNTPI